VHTFKFGGEFRYLQINERNTCAPNGDFTFDGSITAQISPTTCSRGAEL